MTVDHRYELFGWDYEAINPLADEEVNWYQTWAQQTGGPLLALACGTGRLICKLARSGFDITAMDLSDAMLTIARNNIAKLPANRQPSVRLVKADMANFDLAQKYSMIFIADNSFRELNTRKDLLNCLKCIKRHLKPNGKLLITERPFNPSLYHNNRRSSNWSQPIPHPTTGELVQRKYEIRLSKNHKRIKGLFTYKITHPDSSETIEQCPWSGPILKKPEYIKLFARAGFDTQTFADYKQTPSSPTNNKMLCFLCHPKT